MRSGVRQSRSEAYGLARAATGAGPENEGRLWDLGRLVAAFNRPSDHPINEPQPDGILVTPPKGVSDTKFILRIMAATRSYQNDEEYALFPAEMASTIATASRRVCSWLPGPRCLEYCRIRTEDSTNRFRSA